MMLARDPPTIMQALPEVDLRNLRDHYRMSDLVEGRHGVEYLVLVHDVATLERDFLGFNPTPIVIRSAIAPIIVQRPGFIEFLRGAGAGSDLLDEDRLARLALAGAGTLVAHHLWDERS